MHKMCIRDRICDYQTPDENSKLFNTRIRDRICQMSKTLAAATTTEAVSYTHLFSSVANAFGWISM